MGIRRAFEDLASRESPPPEAIEMVVRLLREKQYDSLIGALQAMNGDLEENLEIAICECYDDLRNKVWDEEGENSEKAQKIGKSEILNHLEETHPELHSEFNRQTDYWRNKFWKRTALEDIPQSRGYG